MNQADTAWMLISTALVLLMTPALAFFYGGLVRASSRRRPRARQPLVTVSETVAPGAPAPVPAR
jgi:hypothetical protein